MPGLPMLRPMRLCSIACRAALFALLLPGAGAGAQAVRDSATVARARAARIVSGRAPWVVTYDHVTETMQLRDHRGREQAAYRGSTLADGALLRVPPDRPVEVQLVNANPMLYAYDVTSTVVQERSVRGCRAVLGTFAQAGLQFRALSLGGVPSRWSVDSAMRELVSAEALASRAGVAVRGEPLSPADRARTIELVAERVRGFERTAESVAHLAGTVDDSLATVAELAEAAPAGPLLQSLAASIRQQLPGAARASEVPLTLQRLTREAQPPATVLMQLAEFGAADIADLRTRFDTALTTIVHSYRLLQAQLHRIEQYQAGTAQRFLLEPSGDYRAIRIRLTSTGDFPTVPRLRVGLVEAVTDPIRRLTCTLAPGLALAATPRAYATSGDSVVQSSSSDQRTAASLLLHFDVPDLPLPLGALVGIGLGLQQRPDWYLGGSLRLSDVVRINAGSVWQREERLDAATPVGSVLTGTTRPRFEDRAKHYAPGFFWGISLVP